MIGGPALAEAVGVPRSVLAFLEARLPEVRAVRDGAGGRAYRADDAVLLAGLADLLYRDGVGFREAAEMLKTDARAGLEARGRELLAGAVDLEPHRPAARAIPRDAVVGGRGREAHVSARPPSPDVAALLGELIDCVRVLDEARGLA